MSATSELADFAAGLTRAVTPPATRQRALSLFLDSFGVALGAGDLPAITALKATLRKLSGPSGAARVLGDGERWGSGDAALLNGALIHALDFDDTHVASVMHPSAPILPAAMAAAELASASGARVTTAVVAGYEVGLRIADAITATSHFGRGFHSTATCGTFGAAAAAGNVLGLTSRQMGHAFGLCGSQASGSGQFILDGAWNKPFQVGAAARNGLTAAVLAQCGYIGATRALEGGRGFLRGYSDAADPERLTSGLGEVWQTLEIGVKPYPCCRHLHAPIDVLIELKRVYSIDPEEMVSVRIGISEEGFKSVGQPVADKRRARTMVEGQFSMYFGAAAALLTGELTPASLGLAGRPEIDALAERVTVYVSDYAESRFPAHLSAEVELETTTARYRSIAADPTGEPDTFPSAPAQRSKFYSLATAALGRSNAERLADAITECDGPVQFDRLLALAAGSA